MRELDWWQCYDSSLKGKIVDGAFSHPAKMAWGLTVRIFQHLFDRGWLREGDLVADPFGGIGTTGLVAAAFGCLCILVELEEKFCKLAEENFKLNRGQWEKMGKPHPVILQGDSRQFASLIQEAVSSVITSPPFLDTRSNTTQSTPAKSGGIVVERMSIVAFGTRYGDTEGQIGAMKEGKLDEVVSGIITSPSYSESEIAKGDAKQASIPDRKRRRADKKWHGYGVAEGQLGGMPEGDHQEVVSAICTSPPYASSMSSEKSGIDWSKCKREDGRPRDMTREPAHATRIGAGGEMRYSISPENMGNLPEGSHEAVVDAVITSPVHEATFNVSKQGARQPQIEKELGRPIAYGNSDEQLGNMQGSTYWQAVSEVYRECFKALKPNGIMAVVVKAFVRNKQVVDLPSQTLKLLTAIGFGPLERVRAWLTSEATQKSLMPKLRKDYTKKRSSFFRRLYEKKYPENAIDFEEVLIVKRTEGEKNE